MCPIEMRTQCGRNWEKPLLLSSKIIFPICQYIDTLSLSTARISFVCVLITISCILLLEVFFLFHISSLLLPVIHPKFTISVKKLRISSELIFVSLSITRDDYILLSIYQKIIYRRFVFPMLSKNIVVYYLLVYPGLSKQLTHYRLLVVNSIYENALYPATPVLTVVQFYYVPRQNYLSKL